MPFLVVMSVVSRLPAQSNRTMIAQVAELAMRSFSSRYLLESSPEQFANQIPPLAWHDQGISNFGDCPMNAAGLSNTTRWMLSSLQPRRRISSMVLGTASGSLTPQSQAE